MNKSVRRAPYLILAVAVTLGLFPKGASAGRSHVWPTAEG